MSEDSTAASGSGDSSAGASAAANTEGVKPTTAHPDKITVKISLPANGTKDIKPGQKADVQFAGE